MTFWQAFVLKKLLASEMMAISSAGEAPLTREARIGWRGSPLQSCGMLGMTGLGEIGSG